MKPALNAGKESFHFTPTDSVHVGPLIADHPLPLQIQSLDLSVGLPEWARANKNAIDALLHKHGGILFRHFRLDGPDDLQAFLQNISRELMGYQDRATPRSQVSGQVFTATDYPPEHHIYLHNESSFAHTWPTRIAFYCVTPAASGGETPIADVRRVHERLAPSVRERFAAKGVLYVRNFGNKPFGLAWQTVFQTQDRVAMEAYCRRAGIEFEWRDNDRLRTRQVRPATLTHPVTGERVWFNHATVLHVTTIEPKRRAMLLKMVKEEDLPNNTFYGDGSPIEPETLAALRDAYEKETVLFPWQAGDVLLLDNLLVAHGRRPHTGTRKVLTAMADPMSWDQFETNGRVLP